MANVLTNIKSNRSQNTLIWTIILILSFNVIVSFVNTLTNILFGDGLIIDTLFLYSILILMIISSLSLVINKLKIDLLLIVFFVVMTYILTLSFFPKNLKWIFTKWDDFMNNPIYFNFLSIITYILLRYISDYDRFLSYLTKTSIFIVILTLLNYFFLINQEKVIEYMSISYDALLFVTLLLLVYLEKKNIFLGVIGFIGTLFILIIGARGAFISLVFTLSVYFLFNGSSLFKKILHMTFLIFTGLILFQNYNEILVIITDRLLEMKIDSRTLNALVEASFLEDSGRGEIQKKLLDNLQIFGSGIFGDRFSGFYAHNIFIEILYQWGLILGTIFIALILILLSYNLSKPKSESYLLFITFLSAGFFKLFFSGSYLVEINFAALMGISMYSFQRIRISHKN